ncbi:hypothetical protein [Nocardioides sp.]|uniref:hypothetical protein n=1 Tax=Nocardioides sp. TaxID=35761 RepID=UPI002B27B305|nr:hypothetical protein [Nocardioides sp.]
MSHLPRTRSLLAVLLTAVLVVAGINFAAQAAGGKGKPVLAGKTTTSGKLTTLKRTKKGPALKLRTKAGSPPLAVTSAERVAKLNADQVDGQDAADLETLTYAYQLPEGGTPSINRSAVFPDLPDGTYLVTYAVALKSGGALTTSQCFLFQADAPRIIGLAYGTPKGGFATMASSGRIDSADGDVELRCSGNQSIVFDDTDSGGTVLFTRSALVEREAAAPVATRDPARGNGSRAGTASGE